MKEHLQGYLNHCRRVSGLSEASVASYNDACLLWLRFVKEESGQEVGEEHWTRDWALAWITAQKRAGLHQSTRRTRVAALRTWGAWMLERGIVHTNPWVGLKTPVNEEQHQPCPVPDHVRLLLDACERVPNPTRGAMAKAILVLLAQAGLRLSEALALRVQDLHLSGSPPCVYIESGKGDKAGSVPLSAYSVSALSSWLAARPAADTAYLFYLKGPNLGIRPFSDGAFRDMLLYLKVIAKISDVEVTAHSLRRFAGTMVAQQKGASLADAQKLLRHSNLAVTVRYIKQTSSLPSLVEGILPVSPPAPSVQPKPAEDNRVKVEQVRRKPGWRRG